MTDDCSVWIWSCSYIKWYFLYRIVFDWYISMFICTNIINTRMKQNRFLFNTHTLFLFWFVNQIVYPKHRFKKWRNLQISKRDWIKLQKQVGHFPVSFLYMGPQSDNLRPNSNGRHIQWQLFGQGAWTVSCCAV